MIRLEPDINNPAVTVRYRLIDTTSPWVEPGSWLYDVLQLFLRVENASHILAWAALENDPAVAAARDEDSGERIRKIHRCLAIIELPRLRLRFFTAYDACGVLRVYSSEYSGRHVIMEADAEADDGASDFAPRPTEDEPAASLKKICSVTPHSLLLGDEDGNRYLLVPNCKYMPESTVAQQPWATFLYPKHDDETWLNLFETRVYLYKAHSSRLWLEMPSLEAALLWAYLQMRDKRWVAAAQTIEGINSDEALTPQEMFHIAQYAQNACGDQADTQVTTMVKTRLWLRFRDSPSISSFPFAPKVPDRQTRWHIPAAVRVSHEEEKLIASMDTAAAVSAGRLAYLEAVESEDTLFETSDRFYQPAPACGEAFRSFVCDYGAADELRKACAKVRSEPVPDKKGWIKLEQLQFHSCKCCEGVCRRERAKWREKQREGKRKRQRQRERETKRERERELKGE